VKLQELGGVAEDVVRKVWTEIVRPGAGEVVRPIPAALLARIAPLVEALLRERIGSVGDLRGEVID
jgi:hypothetical protein